MRALIVIVLLVLAACTPPRYANIEPVQVSPVEGQRYKVRIKPGDAGTLEAWTCWSQGALQWRKFSVDSRREAIAATLETVGPQCPGAEVSDIHHDGTDGREHCYEIWIACNG